MTLPTIAILGAGNMGTSLIKGLINQGHPPKQIWATNIPEAAQQLKQLTKELDIHSSIHNLDAIEAADVVVFAIKPQTFPQIAAETKAILQKRHPLIISIAAGIRLQNLSDWLGKDLPIVRAMPNTPALIGKGATALYANSTVSDTQKKLTEKFLSTVGITLWVPDEAMMDTVTALSGSGPAYFFLMMEALQNAAEKLGLPKEIANKLTLQTALGATAMAAESHLSLIELRKNVTSPGGTTEKAISVLEENNIRSLFENALQAAKVRSEELAQLSGEKK